MPVTLLRTQLDATDLSIPSLLCISGPYFFSSHVFLPMQLLLNPDVLKLVLLIWNRSVFSGILPHTSALGSVISPGLESWDPENPRGDAIREPHPPRPRGLAQHPTKSRGCKYPHHELSSGGPRRWHPRACGLTGHALCSLHFQERRGWPSPSGSQMRSPRATLPRRSKQEISHPRP